MSPPTKLALSAEAIEQLAQRVAELVSDRVAAGPPLVDAETLARFLNVERSYVYEHAAELGGVRLGDGPRARLRFDAVEAKRGLTCSMGRGSASSDSRVVEPIRKRRRSHPLGTSGPLLPIRGSGRPFSGGSAA
jgi:hypothetical protein